MKYKLVVDKKGGSAPDGPFAHLSPEQLRAVKAPLGPLLIVAGAGTGKTRTLIARATHLLLQGCDPKRLMVCTFTQRAARELVQRLQEAVGPLAHEIWAGTFHHLGHRLLRLYGQEVGLGPRFSVLDHEDTRTLFSAVLHSQGVKAPLTAPRLLNLFSQAIGRQIPLATYLESAAPDLRHRTQEILELFAAFTEKKIRQQAIDFDDLLALWKIALKQGSQTIPKGFDHILVDEYQDTNQLQGDILDLMVQEHQNITAVGDDAQSIYSFRGAEPENMLQFTQRYPQGTIHKLETNYRSTQQILDIANATLHGTTNVVQKRLVAARGEGAKPALIYVKDASQEAQFVAQRLWELHVEEGIPLHQIAILFRTKKQGLDLELELTRRQIPFRVNSGLRIFEQAHFKDLISYLRVLDNPFDELALLRLFSILPGLGQSSARKCHALITGLAPLDPEAPHPLTTPPLWSQFRGAIGGKLQELGDLFLTLQRQRHRLGDLMNTVLQHYTPSLQQKFENHKDRREELREFVALSSQYTSVEQLLGDLGLKSGPVSVVLSEQEKPASAVVLSTVHQAKGLEWSAVFLLSLFEGAFPLLFSTDPKALEEERRVFHVAVTRARDSLHMVHPMLSGPTDRQRRFRRLSRYVAELPQKTYDVWEIELVTPD